MVFADLLAALAAKTPTPGGGATAAAAGALGAAQAQMVVAYSLGKKDLAEHQAMLREAEGFLTRARSLFLELADEDAAAYARLNALQKLPEGDPRKASELPEAVRVAVQAPMAVVAAAADTLRLVATFPGRTNKYLASDVAVAAIMLRAAAEAGACNVRINTPMLPEAARPAMTATLDDMLARAVGVATVAQRECGA